MTARLPLPLPAVQPAPATLPAAMPAQAQRSVRGTLVTALLALLLLGLGSALFTRYLLSFRVHDYAILNLAGQLRELANGMQLDANQLLRRDGTAPSEAELGRYHAKLRHQVQAYERIVTSFVQRDLPPDLTGLDAPVSCNWDTPSLAQLKATAATWAAVAQHLQPAQAEQAPQQAVLQAAATLAGQGAELLESSRVLAGAFKAMMQRKLDFVIQVQALSLGVSVLAGLGLLAWVNRRTLRPLHAMQQAAQRIMDGELGLQSPLDGGLEIAQATAALNQLSSRMQALFRVSENAGSGLSTAEMLDRLHADLKLLLPVAVLGVATGAGNVPAHRRWRLLRSAGERPAALADGMQVCAEGSTSAVAAELDSLLRGAGMGSVLCLPLLAGPEADAAPELPVLFFAAAQPDAYPAPAQALLRSVAAQVRAQLERTRSTEALVVAAVEGLAKLAESRDPETGEHLERMSAYSAMLAEELGRHGRHAGHIDARYVEEVRRFAPMHDIGKVGIADHILLKPGKLTQEERAEMSQHAQIGADVLRRCEAQMRERGRSVFQVGIEIAQSHHERWDGTGYPERLEADEIPLSARIVALADVLDALTSRRPYKEAWPMERALQVIQEESGRHFDPEVVAALWRCLPAISAYHQLHKHV